MLTEKRPVLLGEPASWMYVVVMLRFLEFAAAMDAVAEFRGTAIAMLAVVDDVSVLPDAVMEAGRTAIAFGTAVGDKVTARPAMMTGRHAVPIKTALIGCAAVSFGMITWCGQRHV